jgi:hypothetical protein
MLVLRHATPHRLEGVKGAPAHGLVVYQAFRAELKTRL